MKSRLQKFQRGKVRLTFLVITLAQITDGISDHYIK